MKMSEQQTKPREAGLEKAYASLDSMLVAGEKIQSTAVQRRLFALLHRRSVVAATTGRLIGLIVA